LDEVGADTNAVGMARTFYALSGFYSVEWHGAVLGWD
jgi:hypothetical protein